MSRNFTVFDFADYRSFLKHQIHESERGFQTKLAKTMGCQAIYLSRSLKGDAQLTEEQGFRAAKFLELSKGEMEYFLDLVRLGRASDPDLVVYLNLRLKTKAEEFREVAKRVSGEALAISLESKVEYYTSWKYSTLHLATSCSGLQTDKALAQRFSLEIDEVNKIMQFLIDAGLVSKENDKYKFAGSSLHLSKASPLHKVFQRERRNLTARALEKSQNDSLHFSSAFATSRLHCLTIRESLLAIIEKTHLELASTQPEDLQIMTIDFCAVV